VPSRVLIAPAVFIAVATLTACQGFAVIQPTSASAPCEPGNVFVYTVATDNTLYRFNPPTLGFEAIGVINCPNDGTAFSMAVDRSGTAWVEYDDGRLYLIDTSNAGCIPTEFVPGQHGFVNFGMGFTANTPGSPEETLFVTGADANGNSVGLGTIDTTTLELTPIGQYSGLGVTPGNGAFSELTGTSDGRLFAFFTHPFGLVQLDKSSAALLSDVPLSPIEISPFPQDAGGLNIAFAFWGGKFWFFVGPDTATGVWEYDPLHNTTTLVTTESFAIVGAGVSTCAPMN